MRYLVYNVTHPVVPINSPQLTTTLYCPVITTYLNALPRL